MNTHTDNQDSRVDVLFLTGQPGAGKTAVAKELSELLWQRHAPHAVIDIDELCRGLLPTRTTDFNRALAVANLQAVWVNYHAAGVRRLILARIVQGLDDIERFSAAIPNARVTVCLITAPQDTIRHRITEREAGSARAFLLSLTARNAEQTAALELPGFRVENDGRTLNDVAREILERAGWT